jgi:DNA-binding transcriptional ArsR family regulator
MSQDSTLLREISFKLTQLLALFKLTNRDIIRKAKEEITNDPVSSKVLELADGTLSAISFKQKIANETKVSEKTVERRISELLDMGALFTIRKGREIFYENSGLLD